MPINNLITVRKGTDTEWYTSAAVLSAGEPGFDTTNNILKIGDGTSDWNNLLNAAVFSEVAIINAASGSTPFSVEGTNGSLFSVVDNLDGTLMSVNNNAGLPVFEVFSDDSIVGGRFGQNDFVLTSSGNLGIGTSSPSGKLHIGSGDLRFDSSYGVRWAGGSRLYEQTATLGGVERMLYLPNGDRFEVLSENGVAIIAGFHGQNSLLSNSIRLHRAVGIGSNYAASGTLPSNGLAVQGNVGIGTTSPRGTLDVTGGLKTGGYSDTVPGSGSELIISNANSVVGVPNTNTAGIVLQHNGYNTVYIRSNPTNFRIGNNAGDALVMTHSDRRIGINTSSPNEQLEVSGHIRLSDTPAGVNQGNVVQFYRGGGGRFDYTIGKYQNHLALSTVNDGSTQRQIQFGFHDGSNIFQPKTIINGFNGYVGIGTTIPTVALDVRGASIFNEAGADFDFRVEGDTDPNLLFVDASTDRVGIGVSNPAYKLDVSGSVNIDGEITAVIDGGGVT